MHRTSLTKNSLSELMRLDTGGHGVLSMYLGFDPSSVPNLSERHAQASSLLTQAEHRCAEDEPRSHEQRMALRADLQRVRDLLDDERELAPESGRGLAIFCCGPADVLELVTLPEPVEPRIVIDDQPYLEPLVELTADERWCVLLMSHRASRVLVGDRDHLVEIASVLDDVHGQHSQGGWSQSRYQRGIRKEADDHIRASCEALYERFKRRPFDRLLIGGPVELHKQVIGELHQDLRRRVAGEFEIDVERATGAEVGERCSALIEADEKRREESALARMREGLAPNGHAGVGLAGVLELLNERRVEVLLLAHGFTAPGYSCPSCGRLSLEATPCPLDGAEPERHEDIVDTAITRALAQSAEVRVLRQSGEQLAEQGSIAALVRY